LVFGLWPLQESFTEMEARIQRPKTKVQKPKTTQQSHEACLRQIARFDGHK
jgi:hypothetical protein